MRRRDGTVRPIEDRAVARLDCASHAEVEGRGSHRDASSKYDRIISHPTRGSPVGAMPVTVLAIDPGSEQSAWVLMEARGRILKHGITANADVLPLFADSFEAFMASDV